eukprot:scaffold846_cov168-Amphora_coffeaeformis.AAC.13
MKLFLLLRFGIVGWVAMLFGSLAAAAEQEVHLPGDTEPPYVALSEQLVKDYPKLALQDAVDIALEARFHDPAKAVEDLHAEGKGLQGGRRHKPGLQFAHNGFPKWTDHEIILGV